TILAVSERPLDVDVDHQLGRPACLVHPVADAGNDIRGFAVRIRDGKILAVRAILEMIFLPGRLAIYELFKCECLALQGYFHAQFSFRAKNEPGVLGLRPGMDKSTDSGERRQRRQREKQLFPHDESPYKPRMPKDFIHYNKSPLTRTFTESSTSSRLNPHNSGQSSLRGDSQSFHLERRSRHETPTRVYADRAARRHCHYWGSDRFV